MASVEDFALNYSHLDRLVHRIAFGSRFLQLAIGDMEATLFKEQYAGFRAGRPVFITALPRAGTTLLLDMLNTFPTVATHTYRDMPFLMAPYLWSRFSAPFQKRAELRQRAHGDGMQVGYDSAEAFEEAIWCSFWPDHYTEAGIRLWQASDYDEEARDFFVEHMKKIVALRTPAEPDAGRYVSKNNGNVARLGLLRKMFPDADILVPFRQPVEHAASLLRQHRNFLELHRQYPFIRKYMADIGHFEFGLLHRRIGFADSGLFDTYGDALSIDYWLAYWIAAYRCVLEHEGDVRLVSYEGLCSSGATVFREVCSVVGLNEPSAFARSLEMLRPPSAPRRPEFEPDRGLLSQARELHAELLGRAIGGAP